MTSGATSLAMVRDELFATMEEAEASLEQFIPDRQNGSLLQRAVEDLQQVRGTLSLIELTGAELLAQEILQVATDIPVGAGGERDAQLASLSSALFVLRRYLEHVELYRQETPELLLPVINELRQAVCQPTLPESFFFSARLDHARPPLRLPLEPVDQDVLAARTRRLRQMYQLGLLGFLREQNTVASLRLMQQAMERLDRLYAADAGRSRFCWVCAAAMESQADGQLLPRKSRKQLFCRIDRELRQLSSRGHYEAPRNLLKELLYLVALANSEGANASHVREIFGLTALPFTDHLLEEQYQRLSGPGREVMRSLSQAIHEELAGVKELLDLIERGTAPPESYGSLHAQLGKLAKTLAMVGLSSAGNALLIQLQDIAHWSERMPVEASALQRLADALLYAESMVASLERGRHESKPSAAQPGEEAASFADHQLNEARVVVLDESRTGLALAKRAITAYLESRGDRLHLANVPAVLESVRGGLWFLEQLRASELVAACGRYIQRQMLEGGDIPPEQMLETLADALTSLEYYLESGAVSGGSNAGVLDLAAESVRALGLPVAA